MPSSHLMLCCPLLLLLPVLPASGSFPVSQLFTWGGQILEFQLQHQSFPMSQLFACSGQRIGASALASFLPKKSQNWSPSEWTGWISDLLAVEGTLKSLLQHHSSKASILRRSAFFTVQLSHPYTTTGKTTALTRQTLVGKVMSLLLNMLSRRRRYCSSFKMRKLVHRDLCPHVLGHRANSRWAKWLSFVKS